MEVAIPIFDRITALDAARRSQANPGARVRFMALLLAARIAGDEVAQAIQLGIEYDPEPPFDSGSVAKAPAPVIDRVRKNAERFA
jgi:hypothetical protein